jgi:transcription-repair coupling factor (superfamily II helicase)
MQDLISMLVAHPPFQELEARLRGGRSCFAEGLWGSSAACLATALASRAGRTILCVLPQIEQAEALVEDVGLFFCDLPLLFPAWETVEENELPDAEIRGQRLTVLKYLASRRDRSAPRTACRLIVAPVQAALQRAPSPSAIGENTLALRPGLVRPPEEVLRWLAERGFQNVRQAEVPGEVCRRGGILDIFPYTAAAPIRVEFFGNEIESLRTYDPAAQTSMSEIPEASITAVPEHHGEEATPAVPSAASSLLDHLPEDTWVLLKEPAEIFERADIFASHPEPDAALSAVDSLRGLASRFPTLHVAELPGVFSGEPMTFHVHSVERFGHELKATVQELEHATSERKRTIVLCANSGERDRLAELLGGSSVLADPRFEIRIGRLTHGFDWTDLSLALLTHHEIFQRYRERRALPRYRHARAADSFYQLEPGDLVVHATHGIGRYHGMMLMERDSAKQECLKIEYADKSFLYVPVAQVEQIQKYAGPSEHRPPLSALGTKAWTARKQRAELAAHELAVEMLQLQAVRAATQGIVHPPDGDWQREFEAAFPFEETDDQLRAAEETKRDMERPRPMDRLICGDVGYGKTEIAMRAAFKAVMGGAQAAVLVPTTVLAAQHAQTFGERMADYPVRIEMLSRFRTPAEQERVLAGLAEGSVDIVIGTHRLVQPDVRFKNLGLVIIDEEQRFGVEHKERLKRLRATVDVLTLTATPIPRTLHMSLLGIRDISSLETPPRDRLAIYTRLLRYDPHKVRQAILHEMSRDGQVYYLYNRVETIDRTERKIKELVPEARVLVGHGQMPERKLAQVMRDFVEHRADMLVCTTIIQSGLDIPNVNTILIDDADLFGLAELHQLRGRVGRYRHRAYAYLLLPADRPITPAAEKRLKAIEEFSELGAGFRIAMRDLEIRGAGNILGPEQSGHIAAVGYDMYCRILERAVNALKNHPAPERPDVTLTLGTEALLPESYVADPSQRIELYRRVQRAKNASDLDPLKAEMEDRFGKLPAEAEALLAEARLRQLAQKAGIVSIAIRAQTLVIGTSSPERAARVFSAAGADCREVDEKTLHVLIHRTRISGAQLISWLARALERGESVPAPGCAGRKP